MVNPLKEYHDHGGRWKLWSICLLLILTSTVTHAQTGTSDLDFARKLYDDGLYLLAADQYQEFARHHPNSPLVSRARFMAAESYFAQQDLAAAEDGYRAFLRQHPQDSLASEAWFRLGECLLQMDRYQEAIDAYGRSRQMAPEGEQMAKSLLGLARALQGEGQFQRALAELDNFVVQYPRNADVHTVHLIRGEILDRLERPEQAAIAYHTAAQTAQTVEDRSLASYRRSHALVESGAVTTAIDLLSQLVRTDSTSVRADSALILLGDLYESEGRHADAAQIYGQLRDRAGDPALVEQGGLLRAGALKMSGDREAAISAYRQWLKDHPESPLYPQARLGVADIFRKEGLLDSAAILLEEVARGTGDEPWRIDAWLQLADLQLQMGHGERALATYRGFIDRYPEVPSCDSVSFLMAGIQESSGHPQAALQTYRDLSARRPANRWSQKAAFAMGRLLETGRQYEQAREAYQAFAQEFPYSPLYPQAKERIQYLSDFRIPEEPLALEAMVDIQDQRAAGLLTEEEVDLRLADIYLRHLRNFDRAAAALERFLDRHTVSPMADQALYQLSRCHAMKAEMLRIDGDLPGYHREREAAAAACRRLLRDHPESQYADGCALRVIGDIVTAAVSNTSPSWQDRKELYGSFLRTYPTSQWRPLALLRVGEAIYESTTDDSLMLARADSVFALVVNDHRSSVWADTAAWHRVAIARDMENEQATLTAGQDFLWNFPDSPLRSRVFFLQAEIHERRGDHHRAVQLFHSVAEDFPYHGLTEPARLREVRLLWALGQRSDAESALESFLRMYPESEWRVEAMLLLAHYAAVSGRVDRSRSLLSEVEEDLTGDSLKPSEKLTVGDVYRQLGEFDEALQRYRAVMEEYGDQSFGTHAVERIAAAHFETGDYDQAEAFYRQALAGKIDESRRSSLESQRIICLYRQGLMSAAIKARKEFEDTYRQEEEQAAALLMEEAQVHREAEDEQAARKALEEILSKYPHSHMAQEADYQLGILSLISGRYQEALERFEALLEQYPQTDLEGLVLFKMGSALYGLQQYPDAARQYRRAAELTSDDTLKVDALFNAGICHARMNDWDGAISAYQQLLNDFSRHPDRQVWSLRLGFAYLESGQTARALETFVGIDPGSDEELGAELQFWVGECYFKMGRFERAAQEYLRVGFLYPQQVQWATTAEYNAGVSYEKLGRTEEARTIYRKLVQTQRGDGQWGQMAQERLRQLEIIP
jgi:TolA-binding protein